ncbi:MAG: sigma 54-interacting transcriptional regulator [Deltaproteobacteria bacterium]|nr:sigma 54-interacting transcriptional regulator [Deltaproteobacteria bacterium]
MTSQTETRRRAAPRPEGATDGGARQLWLRVLFDPAGTLDDRLVEVPRSGLVIGRDEGVDLRLGDGLSSRRHASIVGQRGGGFRVEDLGSANGTLCNRAPVQRAALRDGDVLRIGDTVLLALAEASGAWLEDDGLLGRSAAMQRLHAQIERVGPLGLPVLVRGPTGSGKELVAGALHRRSGRRGTFVPVNSAALPGELVESALFGHRKGAFTHATADAEGAFRAAHRGTLFLDEIGDMPLLLQPRLLRALEAGEVTPVGASLPIPVDVRVVAATHVDLEAAVAQGRFREDLLARVAAVELEVPALAARKDDLLRLATALLPEEAPRPRWSADVVEALASWGWPRQVRELRNVMARLGLLAEGTGPWGLADLPRAMRMPPHAATAEAATTTDAPGAPGVVPADDDAPAVELEGPPDRATLLALLDEADGNVSELARRVGRSRKQVYRWLHAHGIER